MISYYNNMRGVTNTKLVESVITGRNKKKVVFLSSDLCVWQRLKTFFLRQVVYHTIVVPRVCIYSYDTMGDGTLLSLSKVTIIMQIPLV